MPNWCSCKLTVFFETEEQASTFATNVEEQVKEVEFEDIPAFDNWNYTPEPTVEASTVTFEFLAAWAPHFENINDWLHSTGASSGVLRFAECGQGFVGTTHFERTNETMNHGTEVGEVYPDFYTFSKNIMFQELEVAHQVELEQYQTDINTLSQIIVQNIPRLFVNNDENLSSNISSFLLFPVEPIVNQASEITQNNLMDWLETNNWAKERECFESFFTSTYNYDFTELWYNS